MRQFCVRMSMNARMMYGTVLYTRCYQSNLILYSVGNQIFFNRNKFPFRILAHFVLMLSPQTHAILFVYFIKFLSGRLVFFRQQQQQKSKDSNNNNNKKN